MVRADRYWPAGGAFNQRKETGRMDPLCPVCRHKDRSCKVRFLNDQAFFSCRACFEAEEKRQSSKPRDADPLDRLGYRPREPGVIER
jgi:hypothetical protein